MGVKSRSWTSHSRCDVFSILLQLIHLADKLSVAFRKWYQTDVFVCDSFLCFSYTTLSFSRSAIFIQLTCKKDIQLGKENNFNWYLIKYTSLRQIGQWIDNNIKSNIAIPVIVFIFLGMIITFLPFFHRELRTNVFNKFIFSSREELIWLHKYGIMGYIVFNISPD